MSWLRLPARGRTFAFRSPRLASALEGGNNGRGDDAIPGSARRTALEGRLLDVFVGFELEGVFEDGMVAPAFTPIGAWSPHAPASRPTNDPFVESAGTGRTAVFDMGAEAILRVDSFASFVALGGGDFVDGGGGNSLLDSWSVDGWSGIDGDDAGLLPVDPPFRGFRARSFVGYERGSEMSCMKINWRSPILYSHDSAASMLECQARCRLSWSACSIGLLQALPKRLEKSQKVSRTLVAISSGQSLQNPQLVERRPASWTIVRQ